MPLNTTIAKWADEISACDTQLRQQANLKTKAWRNASKVAERLALLLEFMADLRDLEEEQKRDKGPG